MNPLALITGASRGLGRGIALELSRIGYDLVLNYVNHAAAAETTASDCLSAARLAGHDIRCHCCQADIGKAPDRERLISFAREAADTLTLLVNNAGVAPLTRADLLEATEESFDRLMAINVKGPYFLTQLAARWMIERPVSDSEGQAKTARQKIITISSISAYTASPNRGEYCVTKAALAMLTPLYAVRLAAHGINVYEIRPGIMATDMTKPVEQRYDRLIAEGLTPIQRWGTPQDAGKAVTAIALDLLPFSTGEVINVDGGFHLHRL